MSTDTGTMEPPGEYQNSQNLTHLMSDDGAIKDNDIAPNKEMPLVPPNPQPGTPEVHILHVHPRDEGSPNGTCVQHSNMHPSGPLKDFAKHKLEEEPEGILRTNAKRCRLIGKLKKSLKNHSRDCLRGTLGIKPALNAIRLSLDNLTSSVKALSVNLEKNNTGLVEVAKSNASVLLVLSMIANREKEILEAMLNVHASRPSSGNTAQQLSPVDIVASTVPPMVKDTHSTQSSLAAAPMVKDTHSPHSSLTAQPMVKDTHSPHSCLTATHMIKDIHSPHCSLTTQPVVKDTHSSQSSLTATHMVKDTHSPHSCLTAPPMVKDIHSAHSSLTSPPMVKDTHSPHSSRTPTHMVKDTHSPHSSLTATHSSLTATHMVNDTHSPHSSLTAQPIVKDTHSPHSALTATHMVKDTHSPHSSLTTPPMVKDTHSPHSSLTAPPRVKDTHSPHSSLASLPMVDVKFPRSCLTVPATIENGHPPHNSPPNVEHIQLPHSSLFVPAIAEDLTPPQNCLCSSPMVINGHPPHTSHTALSMGEISDGTASNSRRRPGVSKNRQGVQLKRRKR